MGESMIGGGRSVVIRTVVDLITGLVIIVSPDEVTVTGMSAVERDGVSVADWRIETATIDFASDSTVKFDGSSCDGLSLKHSSTNLFDDKDWNDSRFNPARSSNFSSATSRPTSSSWSDPACSTYGSTISVSVINPRAGVAWSLSSFSYESLDIMDSLIYSHQIISLFFFILNILLISFHFISIILFIILPHYLLSQSLSNQTQLQNHQILNMEDFELRVILHLDLQHAFSRCIPLSCFFFVPYVVLAMYQQHHLE
ncbi:hypothetical protein Tco_0760994 [Tanacetum coccineum]